MIKAYFLVGFAFVFALFGYFSLDILVSQYLGDHKGAIFDLRAFIILPITLAVEYVIYFMVSYYLFDRVKNLSFKKDTYFHILSLIANALFLFLFVNLFSHSIRDSIGSDVALRVDDFPATKIYLSSMISSLIILLGVRKVWPR
ncbi:hypothetical protein BS639_18385 [Rouxiella silvae]|uniref:DUF2569 domain-containing protein n=1 Tax=Rouxiella silvae TaxID=1646373 RepID=A0ABX3TX56_9GAMM|nr:hypothetical protein ASE93_06890 [Serratia sp. Leaf50]ORJ19802.1 hypothetical protein BS639_18385 [Rouxiella silvae]